MSANNNSTNKTTDDTGSVSCWSALPAWRVRGCGG
jgi:hypothetical protein